MPLVIFDCDGTLVDSQHMIVAAMDRAFSSCALASPRREVVLGVVGLSLIEAIGRLAPEKDEALIVRLSEAYKDAFHDLRRDDANREPLYDGVREALLSLAACDGVELGIATGKSRRGVRLLLEREDLAHLFSTVQTADTHPSKPNPSMILAALGETGHEARQALMVGDTVFDMEMAAAAGVTSVGVSWGYHAEEELRASGARVVLTNSTGLGPALLAMVGELGEGA